MQSFCHTFQSASLILGILNIHTDVLISLLFIFILQDEVSEHRLVVLFYLNDDNPHPFFKWSDVRPGNYICLHAPAFHSFLDGQVGFRIDRANQVRILSTSGDIISA